MLDPQLLDLLVCPKCKGDLALSSDGNALICAACGVQYPIREDIPILLIDEAEPITAAPAGGSSSAPAG